MELTPEQLEELEAYYQRRIDATYSNGRIVAGFATERHAGLALLADNRVQAARIAELEYLLSVAEGYVKLIKPSHDKHLVELRALKQIRFLANGRDDNDPTPEGLTTDWRRIITICDGVAEPEGTNDASTE